MNLLTIKCLNGGLLLCLSLFFSISCSKSSEEVGSAESGDAYVGDVLVMESNDAMKFSVTKIVAKPGQVFTLTLKNVGSMPKAAMGHNWVLLAKGIKMEDFALEVTGMKGNEFMPPLPDARVLAATKMLGPKEEDSITVTAPTEAGTYDFLCTFPGHCFGGMKGQLIVR